VFIERQYIILHELRLDPNTLKSKLLWDSWWQTGACLIMLPIVAHRNYKEKTLPQMQSRSIDFKEKQTMYF